MNNLILKTSILCIFSIFTLQVKAQNLKKDVALIEEYNQNNFLIDSAIGYWDTSINKYCVYVKWSAQKTKHVKFIIKYYAEGQYLDSTYEFEISDSSSRQEGLITFYLNKRPTEMAIDMGDKKMIKSSYVSTLSIPKCSAVFILF